MDILIQNINSLHDEDLSDKDESFIRDKAKEYLLLITLGISNKIKMCKSEEQ